MLINKNKIQKIHKMKNKISKTRIFHLNKLITHKNLQNPTPITKNWKINQKNYTQIFNKINISAHIYNIFKKYGLRHFQIQLLIYKIKLNFESNKQNKLGNKKNK